MNKINNSFINTEINAIILRLESDFTPLQTEWWPQEPNFVADGEGRVVIHTGGRGSIRVSLNIAVGSPGPVDDSSLAQWDDISEVSFVAEEGRWYCDGSTGELEGGFVIETSGEHRARILARGRADNFDVHVSESAEPAIQIKVTLWPESRSAARLLQYRDRFTGELVRP